MSVAKYTGVWFCAVGKGKKKRAWARRDSTGEGAWSRTGDLSLIPRTYIKVAAENSLHRVV